MLNQMFTGVFDTNSTSVIGVGAGVLLAVILSGMMLLISFVAEAGIWRRGDKN